MGNSPSNLTEDEYEDKAEAETRPFPYRVIDTHFLEFTDNLNDYGRKGGYAFLSHTWALDIEVEEKTVPGEIIYEKAKSGFFGKDKKKMQEMVETLGMGKKLPPNIDPGTSKLLNIIHAAKNMGHRFIWVDSCCINKDISEMEISIPSMGDWFMNADTCLVFLEDLALSGHSLRRSTVNGSSPMPPPRWATRCWTLQEIILSQRAVFFNGNWEKVFEFDRKKPPSLELLETAGVLYKLCRIPEVLICNGAKPDVPPNMILDLAVAREAVFPEDRVYSLMGLLGFKFRPVYGDNGRYALKRLSQHLFMETPERNGR